MGMKITDKELRGLLAKTLSGIWKRVSWKDMTSMKRSSVDVFSERLRAAAGMENVPQMLEKICKGLGLPSATMDTIDIEMLEDERERVRKMMGKESVLVALLTQKEAKEQFETAKKMKGNTSLEGF
jgi:hypothetical protein